MVQAPATLVEVTVTDETPAVVLTLPSVQILVVVLTNVTGSPEVAEAVMVTLVPRALSEG